MRGCAGRFLTLRVEVVVHEIYCSSLVYLHGKLIQKGKEAILAEIIFNEFYNNYKTLFLVFLKLILNQYFIIENAHDRIFLLFKTLYCMGKNNNNPNKQALSSNIADKPKGRDSENREPRALAELVPADCVVSGCTPPPQLGCPRPGADPRPGGDSNPAGPLSVSILRLLHLELGLLTVT